MGSAIEAPPPPRLELHQKIDRSYKIEVGPLSSALQGFWPQSYQNVSRETFWYDPNCRKRAPACGIGGVAGIMRGLKIFVPADNSLDDSQLWLIHGAFPGNGIPDLGFAWTLKLLGSIERRRTLIRQEKTPMSVLSEVLKAYAWTLKLLGVSEGPPESNQISQEKTPMSVLPEVLKANEAYAASFAAKSQLALPPARRFAILTCMDARLDPAKYAGLSEGDAHVIRNAGGRASDDAIRSLVISYKLLGTQEWFVVHHSDCGMALFDDEIMGSLLEQSLETAAVDEKGWHDHGHGPGSVHGHYVKWLTFKDLNASVVEDVKRIRSHPLVPGNIPVYGYYYDVKTGRLVEVPEATAAGKATA